MSNRDEIDFKLILYVHNGFEMETSRRFYWYSCYPDPDLKNQLDKDLVEFLDSRDFQRRPLTVSERRRKYLLYSNAPDCETRISFMASIFAILSPNSSGGIDSFYSKIIAQWSATNSFMYYETFFRLPLLTYNQKLVHPLDFYEIPWINQEEEGRHRIYYNSQVLNAEVFTIQIVTVEEIANDISLVHLLLIDDDPRLSTESLLTKKKLVNRSSQSESNTPMLTMADEFDHLGMVFEDKDEIELQIKEESKESVEVDESFTMTFEDFIMPKVEPDGIGKTIKKEPVESDKKDLKPIIALQNEVGRLKKEISRLKTMNKELISKSSK